MIKCNNCGAEVAEDAAFCVNCGAAVDGTDVPGAEFVVAPISQVLDLEEKRAEAARVAEKDAKIKEEQQRRAAEAMVAEGPAKQTKPVPSSVSAPRSKNSSPVGASNEPDSRSPYAIISPTIYMWLSFLFAIPGVGLVVGCIICLGSTKYRSIRNLATGYVSMHLIVAVLLAVVYFAISAVNPLLINRIINGVRACIDEAIEGFKDTSSPFGAPTPLPFATPPVSPLS